MLVSTEIVNLISNVGFPVGAFVLMWKFATSTLKENTSAIKELTICIKSQIGS
jgi:hypothetical protein